MIVIGITGTIGAGKGAVVDYLKKQGFVHYSAREFILEEVRRREIEPIRNNVTTVANTLRNDHGPSYIIESLFKIAVVGGENSIIESVRAIGELEFLRKQPNFFLIAVDADPQTRYERALRRKSELDHVTFEQFIKDEQREMKSINPTEGNIDGCMKLADFVILNNGTKEELNGKVEEVLKKILPK